MADQEYNARPYQGLITNFQLDHERCNIFAGMGLGKLQPKSEPVLTPQGWRPIGDLRVGDFVIGSDGLPTRVTGVFPQGVKRQWRVTLSDGAWTRAGDEHLWYVESPKDIHAARAGRVLTTLELAQGGLRHSNGNRKWSVPLITPPGRVGGFYIPPVEPYLLGLILGDGNIRVSGAVGITTDAEIVSAFEGREEAHRSPGIVTKHLNTPALKERMKSLGLAGKLSAEKFVPAGYLTAGKADRLALLQGLLDTDGHAMSAGGVEFCSTAEALADAVVELAQSLGGVARKSGPRITRCNGKPGQPSWRVNVKLPAAVAPFRLQRKLAAWVPPSKYPPRRMIDSITPDGEEDSVCISVSAPDRLYTTRHYILTHNTVSTFTACQAKVLAGQSDPILVLAPLRVAKSTWPNEVRKWKHLSGLDVMPIVGSEAERKLALRHDVPVHTCNYDNLPWLVEHYGSRWPYRTVIADECTRLKGFRLKQGGARAAALGKVAFQYAKEYIGLTGTPAPNGLADLWGQMWFVDRGQRLGRTYEAFKNRWFQRSNDGYGVDPLPFAQEQIQAAISDVCLTIRSEDWFDLDAPIVNNIYVDLPVKARVHYRELEKQMLTEINNRQVTAVNAAARTNKCLQIANGAAYLDPDADADTHPRSKEWREVHDAKLQALESIIEEANGMPVLVSYEFKSDVARIRKAFPKARMLDDNPETENEWNAGKIPILLAHPKSAGHGLNLQYGGNILVFFGHNWNLEEYQQIIERIGPVRQMQAGLNRPVYIHHIIARDTVDELVMARRETKASVQDILLEALKHKGYK